jgi:hypothetical protein
MTVTKLGLKSIQSSIGKNNFSTASSNLKVGKVFGVVTTKNTPTKKQFERAGGFRGIGTIFYQNYFQSQNVDGDYTDAFLDTCDMAKPISRNMVFPFKNELVQIYDLPSPFADISSNGNTPYYGDVISIYNDPQQNSTSNSGKLGKTYVEKNDIRHLYQFEGDMIFQNKQNGIRFGSTVKFHSDINEWSSLGEDGDPIVILTNGYITTETDPSTPNIEEINKEQSIVYLTSTQKLPLQPGASIINPRVNTIKPKDYISSQFIANGNRIILNAKKDEVLLFAKGNIELNTDNIVNINAGRVIHLHVDPKNKESKIALGTRSDGSYPIEPVILGNQMIYAFDLLIGALSNLASNLTTAATQDGPIAGCKAGAIQLLSDLERLCDQLDKVLSTKVTTV